MADVVIVDSGGANLASLKFALDRLGARSEISTDARVIERAPRVLLPGVGAAHDAMRRLRELQLLECLRSLQQPLLGICLGMQLLFNSSAEGATECLGVINGTVQRLHAAPGRPVPHMGWNCCQVTANDPLLRGISAADYFYFVHSYAAQTVTDTTASVDYGGAFSAVVSHGNFHGVQFHPERSSAAGARVLANFLAL
jgi:imidazole glycerol-phosphate synthase subunit HisH